ncbi:MAG: AAA family ATPase [Candidatus Rokubacteria bacterium]|nr:AAA family ATPase [Candidatus Rokubacteria bacterium]
MRCSRCQHENPAGAKFCSECGAPLTPSPSYTPRHLAEKILTSRSALEGERKQVTVLFCDVTGSTALAERLGPDGMHALLDRFFDLAIAEVHSYEGTINQFLGDGFMALFGAPLAHEDHARRAVLAALAIHRGLRDRRADLDAPAGMEVAARIGLNTGLVVVGKIGDNLRMDYTAIGDTTNLAARLQALAEPGAVYLGESTYRAVARWVECERLGERAVKGKAEPVTVYRALAARPPARAFHGGAIRGISSPLVGRDGVLAAFMDCVRRLETGRGGVVTVVGEPGLGKSRLVAEARRLVAERDLVWREGRGLSFGQTIGYWPFLEIIKSHAGIGEDDREDQSWAKLEREVASLHGDQAPDILPYLATLLGLTVKGELTARVKYLDGQAIKRQILLASRRFFERIATRRPLVLVFEDLHWIDRSSAELLEHLLPLTEEVPLLVCGVGRPEGESPVGRLREIAARDHGGRYTELALAPLSPAESERLVTNLLEREDLPPRLRQMILARAEGNPFFVEEVIRALIDAGALERSDPAGPWRVTTEVDHVTLPDTLRGVIMARIDRLDEALKAVLKLASVIGRSFFYRVLRAVSEAERELEGHLAALQEVELIRERRRIPELEYAFKHAVVQEATYDTILLDRRRGLHRQVAEALEALFAERLEEFYGVLAYHYSRAEEWGKAQQYLFRAGDQAGRVAADAEALIHYRQAVEAYARAFGDRWDPVQRATLERKMGEALFRRGDHHQAVEYLERSLRHLGAPYPTTRWGVRLAIGRELLRQALHRLIPRLFVRRRAGEPAVAAAERERIYELRFWIDYFVDRQRAVLDSLLLLNHSERSGLPAGVAEGLGGVGIICDFVPLPRLAGYYHRRAVELAEQIGEPVPLGIAYTGLAFHEHLCLAQFAPALDHNRRAMQEFRRAGELRGWGAPATMAVVLLVQLGDLAAALAESEEIARVGRDGGDRQLWGWGLLARGWALLRAGPLEEAASCLGRAIELFEGIPDYGDVAEASGFLGQCYLGQGKLDEARGLLEETDQLIARWGVRGHQVASTHAGLAAAHLAMAEHLQGAERARALARAKWACRATLGIARAVRPTLPAVCRLQGTYEWLRGKPGAAQRWWRRSLAAAAAQGARWDEGATWLEIGRRLGTRADVERAHAILSQIGASPDVTEARRLLTDGISERRQGNP